MTVKKLILKNHLAVCNSCDIFTFLKILFNAWRINKQVMDSHAKLKQIQELNQKVRSLYAMFILSLIPIIVLFHLNQTLFRIAQQCFNVIDNLLCDVNEWRN